MISVSLPAVVSVLTLFPLGVEFECRSWPGLARTQLTVTLVAADGSKNEGLTADIAGTACVGGVQDGLFALLELKGWDVRRGPNDTVIVFAPKGQWVTSVAIKSDGWEPGYRYVLGRPKGAKKP